MINDLVVKKEQGIPWSKEEIELVVNGYTNGTINDVEMTKWLRCVCKYDMNNDETLALTVAMLESGDQLDLSAIPGIKVDKHSTGGVGDKTTLVVAPIVASLGVPVAKMSGRALGHTGGTVDKLESIKGFNISLSETDFINQVNNIGVAITGQTGDLAPADKKIYALRDVTGTVKSVPLITASIMSKKLASGADKIVLDVKVGNGAFCKTIEEATELATKMVNIGNLYGKETMAIITNMNQPLGSAIGNATEVMESIETLKGHGPSDLVEICNALSANMVALAKEMPVDEATKLVKDAIASGKAYHKFEELIKAQGGTLEGLSEDLPKQEVLATKSGYIKAIHTEELGNLLMNLGAGRKDKDDEIDYQVGAYIYKKIGDYLNIGDCVMTIIARDKVTIDINDYLELSDSLVEKSPAIYKVIK